jgi:putative cell wall-binding protein
VATIVTLMMAITPGVGAATAVGPAKVAPAASVKTAAIPDDIYEAIGGDDWMAFARDITPYLGSPTGTWRMGSTPYTERHTLSGTTTHTADNDWFKLVVPGPGSVYDLSTFNVSIEARSDISGYPDPLIEVYREGASYWGNASDIPTGSPDGDPYSILWNDDRPWIQRGSQVMLSKSMTSNITTPGVYFFRVRPWAFHDSSTEPHRHFISGSDGWYTLRIKMGQFTRLAGSDRIKTALTISKEGWGSALGGTRSVNTSVTLVSGFNYPDALAGAPLARLAGGPILLTSPTSLSSGVASEIKRLGSRGVYVLGGTSAVSSTVINQLKAAIPGIRVKRISGTDRFKTASAIAAEVRKFSSARKVAFVAYGNDWPDALIASPLAAYNGAAMLLTGSGALNSSTYNALVAGGYTDVIVLGDTTRVSASAYNKIAAKVGATRVYRVSASNRYRMARTFGWWATDLAGPGTLKNGAVGTPGNATVLTALSYPTIGVASGQTPWDALAAGPFCGKAGAPLLLTTRTDVVDSIFHDDGEWAGIAPEYFNGDAIRRSYAFGGTAVISSGTFFSLDAGSGFSSTGN